MSGATLHRNQRAGGTRRPYRKLGRFSGFESLESRNLFAGLVHVDVDPVSNDLTLTGDVSNNSVEMFQTVSGNFEIHGRNGTLLSVGDDPFESPWLESYTVNFINGNITVELGHGDDTFVFGETGSSVQSFAMQDLTIVNSWGSDKNLIQNAMIMNELSVMKMNVWSYSELKIIDTVVQGDTDIFNGQSFVHELGIPEVAQMEMTGGDSKTEIINCDLQGHLSITNGDGNDIIVIQGTEVGRRDGDATTIYNGDGGSRTTFTANGGTNKLWGDLTIRNGDNLIGVRVFDTVTFNATEVVGKVDIDNGYGDTVVLVQTNSILGSALVPRGADPVVLVTNHEGIDQFAMRDSKAPWGLEIRHGEGKKPQFFGSDTDIVNSQIATHPKTKHGLLIYGDDKRDVISVSDTQVGGPFGISIMTYGGNDDVTIFLKQRPVSMLWIDTGTGNDVVRLQETEVLVETGIHLREGIDELELTLLTKLRGQATLDGGDGVNDTLRKAIDTVLESVDTFGFEHLLPPHSGG